MQAERVILKTDAQGNLMGLPKLPPNTQLEAIFLLPDAEASTLSKRTPPPSLRGTVSASGSSFAPMMSDEDWDATLGRTASQIAGIAEAFE